MRSPEESLVVLVAHRKVDHGALAEAVERVRDWERAVALAARHGLLPLMAMHLAGMRVPQGIARKLAIAQIQTRQRNQVTIDELLRFTSAIERCGVGYAAYKGPAVAQRCYGDVDLRDFNDFDVLICPEALPVVDDVIRRLGYSLQGYGDPQEQLHNRRNGYEETWLAPSGAVLDLHWALTDFHFPLHVTPAELLSRSTVSQLPAGAVRTFCEDDNLIVLATHAAKHRFERLEWLTTIGELMTRQDLQWDAIIARCARLGCRTSVATACLMSATILDYTAPRELRGLTISERDCRSIQRVFERELFVERSVGDEPLAVRAAMFRIFDRRADALKRTVCSIFSPSLSDARAMPLSPKWRWLYFATRPLRLIVKYVRRVTR